MPYARSPFARLTFGALLLLVASMLTVAPLAAQDAEATPDPALYDPTVCADHTDGSALSEDCAAMIEMFPRPRGVKSSTFHKLAISGASRGSCPGSLISPVISLFQNSRTPAPFFL